MKMVTGKTFIAEEVALDGIDYADCKFKDCVFVYTGEVYKMWHCEISGDYKVKLDGAAARTAQILQVFGWKPPSLMQKVPKSTN